MKILLLALFYLAYHKEINRKILLNCITYLKATKRFDEPLLRP